MDTEQQKPTEEVLASPRNFDLLVNGYLQKQRPIDTSKCPFGYLPEAATFYYRRRSMAENMAEVPDDRGFFRHVTEFMGTETSEAKVRALIADLNAKYKDKNIHFVTAKSKTKQVAIPLKGGGLVRNTLEDNDKGMYFVNGKPYFDIDDPSKPAKVNYMYYAADRHSTRLIIINDDLIAKNPQQALVTLAHEYGHELESKKTRPIRFDEEAVEAFPSTEVISTLCGYRMAKLMFDKTGDSKYLEGAALNIRLYNQVIFGNIHGEKPVGAQPSYTPLAYSALRSL